MALHAPHEHREIALDRVGGCIDVDILVFSRDRDHLLCSRIADVPGNDDEFRKIKGHFVEVRYRPTGLGRVQRAGMPHVCRTGCQVRSFGIERIIAAIVIGASQIVAVAESQ